MSGELPVDAVNGPVDRAVSDALSDRINTILLTVAASHGLPFHAALAQAVAEDLLAPGSPAVLLRDGRTRDSRTDLAGVALVNRLDAILRDLDPVFDLGGDLPPVLAALIASRLRRNDHPGGESALPDYPDYSVEGAIAAACDHDDQVRLCADCGTVLEDRVIPADPSELADTLIALGLLDERRRAEMIRASADWLALVHPGMPASPADGDR